MTRNEHVSSLCAEIQTVYDNLLDLQSRYNVALNAGDENTCLLLHRDFCEKSPRVLFLKAELEALT